MSEPTGKKQEGLTADEVAALKARYTSDKGVIDYDAVKKIAEGMTAATKPSASSASPEDDARSLRERTTYAERATARARVLEGDDRAQHLGHLAVAQAALFADREKEKADQNAKGTGGVGGPG
ncbi:MAG: hypothetical protein ACK502_02665 [Alphaproteobacteria bacterium]